MKKTERRKIVIDFEWDKVKGKNYDRSHPVRHEIIEIGAVMLDSDFQELSRFKCYVKPVFIEKISAEISKLTGITDQTLEGAKDFSATLEEFISWCEKDDGRYEIFSWSNSDLIQISKEIEGKGILKTERITYLLNNWNDLQREFDSALGFSKQVSLANALFAAGLDGTGQFHDGLDDAVNTARLLCFLNDPEKQKTIIKKIKQIMSGETQVKTTLGDLIDMSMFSQLPPE